MTAPTNEIERLARIIKKILDELYEFHGLAFNDEHRELDSMIAEIQRIDGLKPDQQKGGGDG